VKDQSENIKTYATEKFEDVKESAKDAKEVVEQKMEKSKGKENTGYSWDHKWSHDAPVVTEKSTIVVAETSSFVGHQNPFPMK